MNMKQLISKNGNYIVYADLSPLDTPSGSYALSFFTQLDNSENPTEQQQKFIMFLTESELAVLQQTLASALT